jgi:hypothetical protein
MSQRFLIPAIIIKFALPFPGVDTPVGTTCNRAVVIGECGQGFFWDMSSGLSDLFLPLKAAGKHWVPGMVHLVSL